MGLGLSAMRLAAAFFHRGFGRVLLNNRLFLSRVDVPGRRVPIPCHRILKQVFQTMARSSRL